MVEGDLQQDRLHDYHNKSLNEQGIVEARAGPVKYSWGRRCQRRVETFNGSEREVEGLDGFRIDMIEQCLARCCHWKLTYLSIEATSMIRGMSREKPALDFVLCMDTAWSV